MLPPTGEAESFQGKEVGCRPQRLRRSVIAMVGSILDRKQEMIPMAIAPLPPAAWKMQVLQGVCPSCERSTALAVFFNRGEMPTGGAVQLRPMCLACGFVWKLPDVTAELLEKASLGILAEKKPKPTPPDGQPD